MSTILWVVGLVLLGILTLTVFGMTITKKAMEDFEWLSGFVDRCDKSEENKDAILEEYSRLLESGKIPTEMLGELRRRIIKKFK